LKVASIVGSGGEAKVVIQAGKVFVNGEVETRRGRKLHQGDVVEVGVEDGDLGFEQAVREKAAI